MIFANHCQNRIEIDPANSYTAIIGLKPSAGARSPALWNAVFETQGIKTRMYPLDVLPEDINAVMEALNNDKRYLGGAVTMPHKETITRWLGSSRLTEEANRIGAVNCLFRDSKGNLRGTNTDGEGALACFVKIYGDVKNKHVFQIGCGGAGKAVAAYFSAAGAQVTLGVRDISKYANFASNLSAVAVSIDEFDRLAPDLDIIINTTDVGFSGGNKCDQSPLSPAQIESLKQGAKVYDIIYDPIPTLLMAEATKRGLRVLDGSGMNLEQAVLGFRYCFPMLSDANDIRKIMSSEKKKRGW